MSPYPPVDERPALLTPDEYMTLLVERAREADEQSRAERAAAGLPPAPAWIRHLPEWMVRDGDEDLVDMAAVADRTDPAWAAAVTPLRCYCGHESCWAFASWEPLPPRGALAPTPVTTRRNAWATREESTWIDKL